MINRKIYSDIENLKKYFVKAKPFPYVVIDDFFEESSFNSIVEKFNSYYNVIGGHGKNYNTDVENGKWTSQGNQLTDDLLQLGLFFQSDEIKSLLSSITGFKTLNTASFNTKNVGFFHLMKNNEIPKFLSPPASPAFQPCLPAPISQATGQKSKFCSRGFVGLVVPIPKRCDMTPLPQNLRRS